MGTVNLRVKIATAYTTQVNVIPTERQLIYSVNAQQLQYHTHNTNYFVSIGLLQGGTGLMHLSALLAAGSPQSGFPIGWTGEIPTEAEMYIFSAVFGPVGTEFLLSAYLMPYIITPERGIQLVP
jgi:hypothetical protein